MARVLSQQASQRGSYIGRIRGSSFMRQSFFSERAELVAGQLEATRLWDRDANLGDVLDREDLLAQPYLVGKVLDARRRQGVEAEPVATLPYPKDDGTYRRTCTINSYDDLLYAYFATVAAPIVNRRLPCEDIVISSRFVPMSSIVYMAEPWRQAKKRRGKIVDKRGTDAVGSVDVASHFPTINRESLSRVCNSCSVPDWLTDRLLTLLDRPSAWPNCPPGLPIGLMGSAFFGTMALLPLDRLLARREVRYERWVDDIDFNCMDQSHFEDIAGSIDALLGFSGQQLNPAKTRYQNVIDLEENSLSELDDQPERGEAIANEAVLRDAVDRRDRRRCRFALGGLRRHRSTEALQLVVAGDDIWELAPKYAGGFLVSARQSLSDDQLEVLADRCSRPAVEENAAAIAHCGRVLGSRRVPGSMGELLFDSADRASTGPYRAVSPTLYYASSTSRERARRRHERSVDTIGAVRDLNSRRALIAGLRLDTSARSVGPALRQVERTQPDLSPTVAWVRSRL